MSDYDLDENGEVIERTEDSKPRSKRGNQGWSTGPNAGAPKKGAIAERLNKRFPNTKTLAEVGLKPAVDVYESAIGIVSTQIARLVATSNRNSLDFAQVKQLEALVKIQLLLENKEAPGSNKDLTDQEVAEAIKLLKESPEPEAEDEYSDLKGKKF